MDAATIKSSTDLNALRGRHVELLQMVENYRNGKDTELTEIQAVAEKGLIKDRLRELGATVKGEVRISTADTRRAEQLIHMGGKQA